MGKKIDLVGQRFGRLSVIEEAGRDKRGKVLWECQCDCGNRVIVSSSNLKMERTLSCGCLQRERVVEANTKHGMSKHPLYSVWQNILTRCGVYKGASDRVYRDYAARGITICDEWHDPETFIAWAIEHGYKKGLQIDRIDNDRGYFPENCRFVTIKQNSNNKRTTMRLDNGVPLAEFTGSLGIPTSFGKSRVSLEYGRIRYEFAKHGSDEAMMRAYGEAIAYRFGMEFVPFRKMFKA